jgi:hypothetical protein
MRPHIGRGLLLVLMLLWQLQLLLLQLLLLLPRLLLRVSSDSPAAVTEPS